MAAQTFDQQAYAATPQGKAARAKARAKHQKKRKERALSGANHLALVAAQWVRL